MQEVCVKYKRWCDIYMYTQSYIHVSCIWLIKYRICWFRMNKKKNIWKKYISRETACFGFWYTTADSVLSVLGLSLTFAWLLGWPRRTNPAWKVVMTDFGGRARDFSISKSRFCGEVSIPIHRLNLFSTTTKDYP